MHSNFHDLLLQKTGATAIGKTQVIQELWSGYGKIMRIGLENARVPSVVVKLVQLPSKASHPRGWNTDLGHLRKVKSYDVETAWYSNYSELSAARLPHCLGITRQEGEVLIILEDLDAAGFVLRKHTITWKEIEQCLTWLAKFHASYLGKSPDDLWPVGTYWHLDTRPDELAALSDGKLKEVAPLIDKKLSSCQYQTFIHGDAKLANFCFASNGDVAGVDFQYVGGGCGMKDVAYFIGSCLDERDCERLEAQILETYFAQLQQALPHPYAALESEWRPMYHVAWADFHRFLKGWSPGHWKLNSYSERISAKVIKSL